MFNHDEFLRISDWNTTWKKIELSNIFPFKHHGRNACNQCLINVAYKVSFPSFFLVLFLLWLIFLHWSITVIGSISSESILLVSLILILVHNEFTSILWFIDCWFKTLITTNMDMNYDVGVRRDCWIWRNGLGKYSLIQMSHFLVMECVKRL